MTVGDNLIVINGQIGIDTSITNTGFVVLSQNTRDISQELSADGKFSFIIPLFKGDNKIQVRATVNGRTGLSPKIKIIQGQISSLLKFGPSNEEGSLAARLEQDPYSVSVRKEKLAKVSVSRKSAKRSAVIPLAVAANDDRSGQQIKVVLTWNKADTDVDLHIYDDYGGHAWYDNLGGIDGGTLDRDDIDGFGPEIFTLDHPRPGKYPVKVHYYSDHGKGPTTATLQVFLAGQLVFQGSQVLSSGQLWNAYEIDVQGITINNAYTLGGLSDDPMPKECQAYVPYPCKNNIFTTLASESDLTVEVSAPESILDSQIHYRVKEKSTNFPVPVTATGRTISFVAVNRPLAGFINPRNSKRLIYEIVAYGDAGIESAPYYIVQDTRSQIRQEYIDKRRLMPKFRHPTPEYGQISNGSNFAGPNFYRYEEMIADTDFSKFGLGILGNAVTYSNVINSKYRSIHPEVRRLRLTSGWRNPRNNDSLKGSSLDSFHQVGGAIDFVPAIKDADSGKFKAQLIEICDIAYAATSGTDVILHLNHVHIEPSNIPTVRKKLNCER